MKVKNKDLLAAAGLTMTSAGMVLAWPTMDLAVARWFYRPGEGFFANDWWPIQAVYKGAPWLLQLALVASALVPWFSRKKSRATGGAMRWHGCWWRLSA
jgi:hypothetical protein